MDDRNSHGESRGVDGRGKPGKAILNHPKIEFFVRLQAVEIIGHFSTMPCPPEQGGMLGSRGQQLLGGAEIIPDGMPGSQGGRKKLREPFFSARLEIAAKNLENPQPPHSKEPKGVSPENPTLV